MFQPTSHQFSPQRRQVLGATGRLSPKKATLGTGLNTNAKESNSVGPRKLFGDLKQQSSTKNVASSSKSGKSRAFGEKTNQSPSRPNNSSPSKKSNSKQIQQNVFTPPTNVGQAGAMRWRMGEMMDAMKDEAGDASVVPGDNVMTSEGQIMTEEELYPEIEYMPPTAQMVYDFPPELDGLPRGAEMGDLLNSIRPEGFYKPKRPESIELQRQQDLEDVPDPDTEEFIAKMWPKEEPRTFPSVVSKAGSKVIPSKTSVIGKPSASGFPRTVPSQAISQRSGQRTVPVKSVRAPVSSNRALSSSTIAKTKQEKENEAKQVFSRKKVLTVKDTNTQRNPPPSKKGKSNAELLDFDNDAMGKQVKRRLRQLEEAERASNGFEGFVL